MGMTKINDISSEKSIRGLLFEAFLFLMLSLSLSVFMHDIWVINLNVYHTILELICIFIALCIFISIWYNYDRNNFNNYVLAFGFLVVAAFDALHTLYFLKLDLTNKSFFDLSTWYWILGRFTEGIVLIVFLSKKVLKIKFKKSIGLMISLLLVSAVGYVQASYHDNLPILLTRNGVTSIKSILEFMVIVLFSISLYRAFNKLHNKESITYSYIFSSLLMMIPSELCFALYNSVNSITWTIGHVLKIFSYYFLLKGTFASTIIYSYEKLEDKHKQLEEAHEKANLANNTINEILNDLPIAVLLYDLNNRVKYVNKKFEELFHCNRTQLLRLTAEEVYKVLPCIESHTKTLPSMVLEREGKSFSSIRTYELRNGESKKFYVTSNKISSGVIAMFKDAKEEQELKNLSIQTETILNAVNNCILMIDTDKKVILCNKALEDLLDMSKKDIIGLDIDKLNKIIKYEGREIVQQLLDGAENNKIFEAMLTSMSGNKKEVLVYCSYIENVDGEIIGAINVSTDITKLKEEQLKLQQQEKLALLGQLGAGIVHETRNYLTTIKGRCQLIELLAEDKRIKTYADKIDEDVTEVNRIISEFLFLSKPRDVELEETSMYDIFGSIKSIVETSSLVKGVNVNMEISEEERYLLCDEVQIKQVILNICKNAVEAMEDVENPKLSIITGFDESKNEAYIKIGDNGKGISNEDLNKIGTLFFTTKKNGTGLGLNMCYKIIQQHNGRIEIESILGRGTFFTITLPCIPDDDFEEAM